MARMIHIRKCNIARMTQINSCMAYLIIRMFNLYYMLLSMIIVTFTYLLNGFVKVPNSLLGVFSVSVGQRFGYPKPSPNFIVRFRFPYLWNLNPPQIIQFRSGSVLFDFFYIAKTLVKNCTTIKKTAPKQLKTTKISANGMQNSNVHWNQQ